MKRAHDLHRPSARAVAVLTSLVVLLTTASATTAYPAEPSASGTVFGRLVDEDGLPVQGIEVGLEDCESVPATLVTGADGRFRLSGSCTTLAIWLRDPEGRFTTLDSKQEDDDVLPGEKSRYVREALARRGVSDLGDIQLRRPVRITGRVVDPQGGPVGSVYTDVHVPGTLGRVGGAFSDAQGRFDLGQQFAGTYSLRADDGSDDEFKTRTTIVVAAPGDQIDLGDTPLVRDYFPTGTVDSGASRAQMLPVAQARITAGLDPLVGHSGRVEVGTYRPRVFEHGWLLSRDPWYGTGSYRGAPIISVAAGRTTTLPPVEKTRDFQIHVKDSSGETVDDVFVAVYRSDDPNEVMATEMIDEYVNFGGFSDVDYEVVVTDPWGRYPTVRRPLDRSTTIDVGPSRNDVPAQPAPDLSGPTLPGRVFVDGQSLNASLQSAVVVQAFRADDPSRPVDVWLSGDSAVLPAGTYKFRLWDPTGRRATIYAGGATSFATAASYAPYIGRDRTFPVTATKPNFVPVVSPRVTGTRKAGSTLRGDAGVWNGSPNRFSYQWYSGGKPVSGQTATTYKLRTSDVGRWVRLRVTARTSSGATKVAFSRPITSTR